MTTPTRDQLALYAMGEHDGDPGSDFAEELLACPGGERLQRCGFHQREIRFPLLSVFTSAERRASR